ncbi:Bifunctional monodehydroascorbate reductase and carbonic anhydrase nectarin-3 [Platanthera guangdongensis]|uniref:Carbonic anhydrase n=1 Tax=Platanthera guangdongensis TaxID=2320717 RepID=A0ABR2LKY5_9ASPA
MVVPSLKLAVLFLLLLLCILLPPPSSGQEVEDEKEFSYKVGSENGPEKWGQIHDEWAACGAGKLQSPIDLQHERVEVLDGLGPLRRTYRPAPAILKNRGHDIMLKWEEVAGGVWINGTEYWIKQLHWHVPSEHTIDGRRFSLELHMVHESADKKIAVVGILYKLGRPDGFLAQMSSYIKKLTDLEDAEEKVGVVHPRKLQWGSRKYYRYIGSLTTPPCTEGVIWTIIKKVLFNYTINYHPILTLALPNLY